MTEAERTQQSYISLPPKDYLWTVFNYSDGRLAWRKRPRHHFSSPAHSDRWNSQYAGAIAGSIWPSGYRYISLDGNRYRAHRVVYAMFHCDPEKMQVDHINGIKDDNRIENLRLCDTSQNHMNIPGFSRGLPKNVSRRPGGGYIVSIYVRNKSIAIGTFKCVKEAEAAAIAARIKYHGKFANHEVRNDD